MPTATETDEPQKAEDFLGPAPNAEDFLGENPGMPADWREQVTAMQERESGQPSQPPVPVPGGYLPVQPSEVPQMEANRTQAELRQGHGKPMLTKFRESLSPFLGETALQRLNRPPGALENIDTTGLLPALSKPAVKIPRFTPKPEDEKAVAVAKAAWNVAAGLPEFFESPMGALTGGAGASSKIASRAIAGGFAADMAAKVPESARAAGKASVTGTTQEKAEAILGLASEIGLPAALAVHAATGGPKTPPGGPPARPQAELPPELAAAQKALPRAAEAAKQAIAEQHKEQNAIQERSTETLPLGETPGDSGKVGARAPEPETPAKAQEAVEANPPGARPAAREVELSPLEQKLSNPDTFKGKDWTKDSYTYATDATPEQLTELAALEKKYADEMTAIPKTVENFAKIGEIGKRKQWATEALRFRRAVDEAKSTGAKTDAELAAIAKKHGVGAGRGGDDAAYAKDLKEGLQKSKPAEPISDTQPPAPPTAPEGKPAESVTPPAAGIVDQTVNKPESEPVPIGAGPGAATRPDIVPGGPDLPTNPGNPDIYGVAERVRKEREAAGQTAPTQPGEGISAPDSVERGRELLDKGTNPEIVLSAFEQSKRLSADDMAVIRAHGEELAKEARRIEEKHGTDSDEYRAAWQKLSDWDARSKAMQTEWHKTGQAQQGETDLDTGSFTGLQRAYKEATGEEFTPAQTVEAQKAARKVKVAAKAAENSKAKLYQQLEMELGNVDVPAPKNLDEARMQFAAFEKGGKMTPQQVKTLWNAALRFYLDKGITNFDDIRNGLATDFGIPVEDVTRGLAQPKGVKRMTDEMYVRQTNARRTVEQARRWLLHTQMPKLERALRSIPNRLFRIAVGFHGTVALGTHAPMVLFQPPFWKTYVTAFGKMYKMVGSPAYYERQIQDLMRRPNYVTARRSGLVNDPFTYEDYNSPDTARWIGRLSGMGNRGYSVLKILRQDMFDQHWHSLPETTRTPEVAEALADGINHATGVTKKMAPKGANLMLFAPRLEASRAAWLAVDPARALNTALNWKNAGAADKLFAVNQVKEKAWVLGTMGALLALNQGILSATGSKQKINLIDPMRSDWLKFKAAGMQMGYGNAMVSMARLPVRLFALRHAGGSGKLAKLVKPDESMSTEAFKYLRSQFSPFAGLLADLAFKGDYENRPLPPMPLSGKTLPMPKRLAEQGVKPYTWTEFITQHALPIPLQEAAREVWRHGLGMSPEQVRSAEKALLIISIMSGTGARVSEDTQTK